MSSKKHPCADCRQCQWCSDDRCRLCLRAGSCRKKLSIAEQIALYEQLNRAEPPERCEKSARKESNNPLPEQIPRYR